MRILLVGSQNPWRMESAVERAFKRAGHDTLLIDDRRTKRLIGRGLTQHWAIRHARKFGGDFVFLSKCLALDPESVGEIIRDRPNAMWYHDPQWHAEVHRPDIAHIATIGKLARTFFVTGFGRTAVARRARAAVSRSGAPGTRRFGSRLARRVGSRGDVDSRHAGSQVAAWCQVSDCPRGTIHSVLSRPEGSPFAASLTGHQAATCNSAIAATVGSGS